MPYSHQKAYSGPEDAQGGTRAPGGVEQPILPDKTQIVLILTALRDVAAQIVTVLNALIMILSN